MRRLLVFLWLAAPSAAAQTGKVTLPLMTVAPGEAGSSAASLQLQAPLVSGPQTLLLPALSPLLPAADRVVGPAAPGTQAAPAPVAEAEAPQAPAVARSVGRWSIPAARASDPQEPTPASAAGGQSAPAAKSAQPAGPNGGLSGALRRVLSLLADPFGKRGAAEPGPAPAAPEDLEIGGRLAWGGLEGIVLRTGFSEADVAFRSGGGWKLKTLSARQVRKAVPAGPAPAAEAEEAARALSVSLDASRARLARVRGYRRFQARDFWAEAGPALKEEILRLRALPPERRAEHLRRAGDQIVEAIGRRHGTGNVGFHYNLHGGQAEGYVEAGGIRISRGDIALEYTMFGDVAYKVYFFQSSQHGLYEALDQRNPNLFSSRMGHVLNVFRLDAPELEALKASGAAYKHGPISLDFDEAKLARAGRGMIGIPYEAYVAPPLEVFPSGLGKRLGVGGLSRDEETLAAMRYIEAAALAR